MVLAIIMDVYNEVRNAAESNESVLETIQYSAKRLYYWRHWIADDQILEELKGASKTLTTEDLQEWFPNMPELQQEWLIKNARGRAKTRMRTQSRNSWSGSNMTAAIKVGLDKVSVLLA